MVFDRVFSSGAGNFDATWEHTGSPGPFYKAVIVSNHPTFDLKLRDGTTYIFYGYSGNKLQAIRDRFGNLVEFSRSPALHGPITKVISPNGRYIELTYDGGERIISARDNIGRTVSYEYETSGANSGRLKKVTMPDGGVWQYTYTSAGRIESIMDPRNNRMVLNEYDNGRVSKQTYADNTTVQIAYTTDSNGNVTQADVTDKRGNIRRVKFDANQQITENTYPLGRPEEQVTRFERDPISGRIVNMIDALNRKTSYTYDSLGNVASVTRLATTPNAVTESYTYGAFSLMKTRTDALGRVTYYTYDGKGNLTQIKDPNNNLTTLTPDGAGRVLTSKNGLNHITTFAYNGPDLISMTDPLGKITKFGYDAIGRMQVLRDPLNNATEFDYDQMSRQIRQKDALGGTVDLQFDVMGNLLRHQDKNANATLYTYDVMNRLATRQDALLAGELHAYEAGSEKQSITDRKGQVIGRKVDGLGRMTFIGYGATTAASTAYTNGIRYTWDAGDRLVKLEDGTCTGTDCATFTVAATIDRLYDGLNRLIQETSPQGQVNYTYYANGLRQSMTVAGQPAVSYTYDTGGRLTQIQQAAGPVNGNMAQTIGFTYDPANRRTQTTLTNGITIDYAYDNASRLTGIAYRKADATLIGDLTYGYDAAGRRTTIGGSLAGNELPGDVAAATYNANNQLTAWGASTLSYDANGNLTSDGAHSYVWNGRNQLVEIRQGSDTGPVVVSYQYDAVGRRVGRTQGGTTTGYLHDGWNVVQELNGLTTNAGKSNYKANVINGMPLDERYVRIVAPNSGDDAQPNNPANPSGTNPLVTHFLADALGSTILLTKADQSVQSRYTYEPYGRTVQTTPPGEVSSDNPYQYTGRENEAASVLGNQVAGPLANLYHYRHRFYSTELGRFVSEDPIEFAGGPNLYAYVDGNPISYTDPEGLRTKEDCDRAYNNQIRICKMSPTPAARSRCYSQAMILYSACLASCK